VDPTVPATVDPTVPATVDPTTPTTDPTTPATAVPPVVGGNHNGDHPKKDHKNKGHHHGWFQIFISWFTS
jgi:hypothetical protein